MTDYTWPATIIPAGSEWRLIANTASFGPRTLARPGDRWGCTLSIPVLPREKALTFRAFLSRLRGHTHRVVLPNHGHVRGGALLQNALVDGAGQTGTTLNADNVEWSLPYALRAGDFISVNGRLHMVAADCSSEVRGVMAITLANPIDTAPADNAPIEILNPTGRFILTGEAQWSNLPAGHVQFGPLEFIEDVP